MGHYAAELALFSTLLANNLPAGWIQRPPNRKVVRPAVSSDLGRPSKWLAWDIRYEGASSETVGRTRTVRGSLYAQAWVQANAGVDEVVNLMERLDALTDSATSGTFALSPLSPGDFDDGESDPSWYIREMEVPFLRLGSFSLEDIVTIAGVGSTSTTYITEEPHGLNVRDWVGRSTGAWRRVRALDSEPSVLGLVSEVLSDTAFILTSSGGLKLPSHGWPVGPLYLSQTSAGQASGTAPSSGVLRQVAEVVDEDNVIVLDRAGVIL
jgi:hypothetical protein